MSLSNVVSFIRSHPQLAPVPADAVTPMLAVSIAGVVATPYVVLTPTGGDDTAMLTGALANNNVVYLAPGVYDVHSQVLLPTNHVLLGSNSYTNPLSQAWPPSSAVQTTVLKANSGGSWSNGDGIVRCGSFCTIRGVAFQGFNVPPAVATPQVSGVRATQVASVLFDDCTFANCYYGIDLTNDGSLTGPDGRNYEQEDIIRGCMFTYNYQDGVHMNAYNGGFCSDMKIQDCMFELAGYWGNAIYMANTGVSQVNDCRIEGGGSGIYVTNSSALTFNGLLFDRTIPFTIDRSGGIAITGCWLGSGSGGGQPNYFFIFSNNCDTLNISGNSDYADALISKYTVSSGTVSSSLISDPRPSFDTTLTKQQLVPMLVPAPQQLAYSALTLTSGAFAAPDFSVSPNLTLQLVTGVAALPVPVFTATGLSGTFAIAQGPAGSCTITFNPAYLNPPTLSAGAYVVDFVPWTTSPSGAVVFGNKYSAAPAANLIAGGNAMTSGWVATGGAFATNVITDPIGGSTGSRVTEDTSNGVHGITQAVAGLSASTTYTFAIYLHAGSSGSREIAITAQDSSGGNSAVAMFTTAGAAGPSGANGSGGVIGFGSSPFGGGWYRTWLTFVIGAAPTQIDIWLSSSGAVNPYPTYIGDGASNLYFWGPTLRVGSSP